MAISETTKHIAAKEKGQLRQRYENNLKEIEEWRRLIKVKQAENVALKTQYDALEADIPEPTPVPAEEV